MKVFEGLRGIGISEHAARKFLTHSKSNLLFATTNVDGTPTIHPVWYYFDTVKTKLHFCTEPDPKGPLTSGREVYFDVDHD